MEIGSGVANQNVRTTLLKRSLVVIGLWINNSLTLLVNSFLSLFLSPFLSLSSSLPLSPSSSLSSSPLYPFIATCTTDSFLLDWMDDPAHSVVELPNLDDIDL